jgi:hypothetical protein
MTSPLPDPRTNAYRPDLAAAYLEGIVQAERFVEGVPCQLRAGFATVKATPDFEARQTTQALFGETVTVYDEHDGWVSSGANATRRIGETSWSSVRSRDRCS